MQKKNQIKRSADLGFNVRCELYVTIINLLYLSFEKYQFKSIKNISDISIISVGICK